jgi:hypothetical protein
MDFLVLQIINLTTTTTYMLSLEQPAKCQEQTDEQIQEQIDMHGTYWLDECIYILKISYSSNEFQNQESSSVS